MDIPDTPQALLEASSSATLRLLHPEYDALHARDQRLVRLIQAELLQGALSDDAFASMLTTVLRVQQHLVHTADASVHFAIEASDTVETEWIDAVEHFARMQHYAATVLHLISEHPGVRDPEGASGHYRLYGPGDVPPEGHPAS